MERKKGRGGTEDSKESAREKESARQERERGEKRSILKSRVIKEKNKWLTM